ncbi:MAG: hypothetical protein ACI8XO_003622 [Verrucomicrobiales bacterium]|jgi:hypothetical protein
MIVVITEHFYILPASISGKGAYISRPMTRVLSLLSSFACICSAVFLCACDESEAGKPKVGGTGQDISLPPLQKAIYLRAKGDRLPGTVFHNRATLTMAGANLTMTRADVIIPGSATMIMRDLWEVEQVSPTERTFKIDEMSRTFEAVMEGKPKQERTESTLTGIPFEVTRTDSAAPWVLSPSEIKLTHLQEIDLRMLGTLWDEGAEDLYPAEPLKLGQVWKADPKAFGIIVSPRLIVEEGEVTCRLDEITVLRGQRCGAISVDIDITGTFQMAGSAGMKVQIALTGTIMRSLYKNYDMRTELKGSMQLEMHFPEQDTTISIDGVAEFLQLAEMTPPENGEEAEEAE